MRGLIRIATVVAELALSCGFAFADAQASNRDGIALAGQRNYAEAEAKFKSARMECESIGEARACTELPSILTNLGSLYYSTGRPGDAEPLLERAVGLWPNQNSAGFESTLHNLAAVYRAEGRFSQALPVYERALSLREAREGSAALSLLPLLNGFALLQRDIGDYARAREIVDRARSIAESNREGDSAAAADGFATLGELLELQGSFRDARTWLGRALFIREHLFGPESNAVMATLNDLAMTSLHEGRFKDAEDLFRRLLRTHESAETLQNLGKVLLEQERPKEAEKVLRQAVDRATADHANASASMTSLAALLISERKYKEADSLLHRASEINRLNLAPDDPKIGFDLINTAALASARKRYTEAESLLQQAEAILRKKLPRTHPEIGRVMASLAEIRSQQGRLGEAEELYRQAVAIFEQAWGPENPQLLSTLESYSRVLRERRDFAEAERLDVRSTKIRVVQTLRSSD